MSQYLFIENDLSNNSSEAPAYLEGAELYLTFEDLKRGEESNVEIPQPPKKKGKRNNKETKLPPCICVKYKGSRKLSFDIHLAWGGIILPEETCERVNLFEIDGTRASSLKFFDKKSDDGNEPLFRAKLFLPSSIFPIIDMEQSIYDAAPLFSRKYERVVQLEAAVNYPVIFKPSDISGYWAVRSVWMNEKFPGGVRGILTHNDTEFSEVYNKKSIFDIMMKMNN